jgi:hypothetical protein
VGNIGGIMRAREAKKLHNGDEVYIKHALSHGKVMGDPVVTKDGVMVSVLIDDDRGGSISEYHHRLLS